MFKPQFKNMSVNPSFSDALSYDEEILRLQKQTNDTVDMANEVEEKYEHAFDELSEYASQEATRVTEVGEPISVDIASYMENIRDNISTEEAIVDNSQDILDQSNETYENSHALYEDAVDTVEDSKEAVAGIDSIYKKYPLITGEDASAVKNYWYAPTNPLRYVRTGQPIYDGYAYASYMANQLGYMIIDSEFEISADPMPERPVPHPHLILNDGVKVFIRCPLISEWLFIDTDGRVEIHNYSHISNLVVQGEMTVLHGCIDNVELTSDARFFDCHIGALYEHDDETPNVELFNCSVLDTSNSIRYYMENSSVETIGDIVIKDAYNSSIICKNSQSITDYRIAPVGGKICGCKIIAQGFLGDYTERHVYYENCDIELHTLSILPSAQTFTHCRIRRETGSELVRVSGKAYWCAFNFDINPTYIDNIKYCMANGEPIESEVNNG